MDELASMRRKLAGAVDSDAPKAALEPSLVPYYNPLFADRFSWALEFRIRCGSVSLRGQGHRRHGRCLRAWRHVLLWQSSRLSIHLGALTGKHRQSCSTAVVATVAYLDDITSSRSASYDFARSGFVAERQLPLSEHSIVCAGPAARPEHLL